MPTILEASTEKVQIAVTAGLWGKQFKIKIRLRGYKKIKNIIK